MTTALIDIGAMATACTTFCMVLNCAGDMHHGDKYDI